MNDKQLLEWYDRATAFHIKRAPGLLIGAALVDAARIELGETDGKINAVCESVSCLCDVVQLMTGCTLGNRYLKTYASLGRFALTLFDRDNGNGVRAFIDLDKIDATETPELHRFFHRQRGPEVKAGGPARLESGKKVVSEFLTVRQKVIGLQKVSVIKFGKEEMLPAARCENCHESFLQRDNARICDVCSGSINYFKPQS